MRTNRLAALVNHETSRFPYKECLPMPGSPTTPGRRGACDSAPLRMAFRVSDGVGTRNIDLFAAQWLACTPLSTLHVRPHGRPRMTRGGCGSLLLHRNGLAPSALCRSPGAPDSGRSIAGDRIDPITDRRRATATSGAQDL